MASKRNRPYLSRGRLSDVVALIQVLAFDEHSHRSESGMLEELQRPPQSASAWTKVATEHPEFFRVRPTGGHVVSLLARHVSPHGDAGRQALAPDYVKELVNTAVAIHDREVNQARAWHVWLPLIGVIVGAVLTGLGLRFRP